MDPPHVPCPQSTVHGHFAVPDVRSGNRCVHSMSCRINQVLKCVLMCVPKCVLKCGVSETYPVLDPANLSSGTLTGANVLNKYIFNSSWWDLIPNQVSLPVINIIPALNQATVTVAYLGDTPNGMFQVSAGIRSGGGQTVAACILLE